MAQIQFFTEDISYRIRQVRSIRSWLLSVLEKEGKAAGEISIILCSDPFLHEMNVRYLDHDTLTDIITFDYSEDGLISGDLFISLDRTRENARSFGVSPVDELHRVMVHGVLHLCGYKDKSLKDSKLMRSKEDFYLSLRPF